MQQFSVRAQPQVADHPQKEEEDQIRNQASATVVVKNAIGESLPRCTEGYVATAIVWPRCTQERCEVEEGKCSVCWTLPQATNHPVQAALEVKLHREGKASKKGRRRPSN